MLDCREVEEITSIVQLFLKKRGERHWPACGMVGGTFSVSQADQRPRNERNLRKALRLPSPISPIEGRDDGSVKSMLTRIGWPAFGVVTLNDSPSWPEAEVFSPSLSSSQDRTGATAGGADATSGQ